MELTLTTPGLFFPAISLLLLAYNNRFLALAQLIRSLHARWAETREPLVAHQIRALRARLHIIVGTQSIGIGALLLAVLTTVALFAGAEFVGRILFGGALGLMAISLSLSIWEIWLSMGALELELADLSGADGDRAPRSVRAKADSLPPTL